MAKGKGSHDFSRLAGAPLLLVVLIAGCANAAEALPVIPGTPLTLDETLFLPGRDTRYRFDISQWRVCRSTRYASGARLELLDNILGDREILRLGEEGSCKVRFSPSAVEQSADDLVINAPGCRMVFQRAGEILQSVQITPDPYEAEQFEKCLFRIGLFLQGFNGAAVIEDERLFVRSASSFWATYPSPPRFTPLFQYILSGCSVDLEAIEQRSDIPPTLQCVNLSGD